MDANSPLTEKIIAYFAYPLSLALALMFAIFILRKPLSNLIDRIRNISGKGIDTTGLQPQQVKEKQQSPLEDVMKAFDSVVLLEYEKRIKEDIDKLGLTNPEEAKKVLIRQLATTQITLTCEIIYKTIYGSQLKILEHLNTRRLVGDTLENIKQFYDAAVAKYPEWYKGYSFDDYIRYLKDRLLINVEEGKVKITVLGVEFLGYLIKEGLNKEKLF